MRATEFAEDNFGTNPRRAARPGSRPHRGHEPIPQYRSMSETASSALQVGDPVIITGNVEYQGKTGDVREVGRDGAFVVVDLYNYGPYSFHASDVSYNDYADSEDELNEFALDDSDDPTEDYPCYDCGSTIFLHHTKLCDLAEPNAKRDLPEEPGTQYWTGEIPKGLAPIPGLAEDSLNEFAVSGDGDGDDNSLFNYAKMWYNGDLKTQRRVEKALQKSGLDIGENEDENGGAYISDMSGDYYESWTAEDLEQGVAEGSNAKTIKPITPAAKRYHEKHQWLLNGNIPGAAKEHYAMIQKLNQKGVAEEEKVGNMPADKFDDAMARLKKLAGAGPLKTVWDPQKRVYKNVPTAVQPKK